MASVPVTPLPSLAYLQECFDYNPETGVLTWKTRPRHHFSNSRVWNNCNVRFAGKLAGTIKKYRDIRIGCKAFKAHRIIWKLMRGTDPVSEIDHKDRNGLDNSWTNLRLADHVKNSWNRNHYKGRTYPKGVSRERTWWIARISVSGQVVRLGRFNTPEEAHAAYAKAAVIHHGEFANPAYESVPARSVTPMGEQ